MTTPTVVELPRRLEPTTPDTFLDEGTKAYLSVASAIGSVSTGRHLRLITGGQLEPSEGHQAPRVGEGVATNIGAAGLAGATA